MLEVCLYDQWYHCVHGKDHGQWVEGDCPSSLFYPGEATSGILYPALGSPLKKNRELLKRDQ